MLQSSALYHFQQQDVLGTNKTSGEVARTTSSIPTQPHPLDNIPIANLVAGWFAVGNTGTKSVENIFKNLRRTEQRVRCPAVSRFRALITTIRSIDHTQAARMSVVLKKRRTKRLTNARKESRKLMQLLGLKPGRWKHEDKCFVEQEMDADVIEKACKEATNNDSIQANELVFENKPLVLTGEDWRNIEPGLAKLMQKCGGGNLPNEFYDYSLDFPRGWQVMTKMHGEADPLTGKLSKANTVCVKDKNMLQADIIVKTWARLIEAPPDGPGLVPGTPLFNMRLADAFMVCGREQVVQGEMLELENEECFLVTISTPYGGYGVGLSVHPHKPGLYALDPSRTMEPIMGDGSRTALCHWKCELVEGKCLLRIEERHNLLKTAVHRAANMDTIKMTAMALNKAVTKRKIIEAAAELFSYTPKQLAQMQEKRSKKAKKAVIAAESESENEEGEVQEDNNATKMAVARLAQTVNDNFVCTAYAQMDNDVKYDFKDLHQQASNKKFSKAAAQYTEKVHWNREKQSSKYIYLYMSMAKRVFNAYAKDLRTNTWERMSRAWGGMTARTCEEAREQVVSFVLKAREKRMAELKQLEEEGNMAKEEKAELQKRERDEQKEETAADHFQSVDQHQDAQQQAPQFRGAARLQSQDKEPPKKKSKVKARQRGENRRATNRRKAHSFKSFGVSQWLPR